MNSTNSRGGTNWRGRKLVAILAVSAAFVGAGQALSPAPAMAMVDLGGGGTGCPGEFWIDQFCSDQKEIDGGGELEEGGGSGGEVIVVTDPTCGDPNVVCVPVGGDPSAPAPTTGTDQDPAEEPFQRGRGSLPPCKKGQNPRTANCSQHGYRCVVKGGKGEKDEVKWVNTPADCRRLNSAESKPEPQRSPQSERSYAEKQRLCGRIDRAMEDLDKYLTEGLMSAKDYSDEIKRYRERKHQLDCYSLYEPPF